MSWVKQPLIYEINTWVWLQELSQRYQTFIDLANVPPQEWNALASLNVDAVWLMGVWERSPVGVRIALENQGLMASFQSALPDFTSADVVGSPYCVRNYRVDDTLGGPNGLAIARQQLSERGLRLILDYVPNHVAPDHPWVCEHPEYFIQGTPQDLQRTPNEFFAANGPILTLGRDPYFPPWPDVVQLNAFNPELRQAVIDTLSYIASQCDGVRCDMAMLFINRIFASTWRQRAGTPPDVEFWHEVIPAIRQQYPDILFIAEAYWDLEWELQQLGFDFCYDKRLYDRIDHESPESVRLHLKADLEYQQRLVRFIENHDEPRAAAVFSPEKSRAAAVAMATLPGAKLFHEGQLTGSKIRLPVFLRRRLPEPVDPQLFDFYGKLLQEINRDVFKQGEWTLCDRLGWPDNQSYVNLITWSWSNQEERYLIAVNLSNFRSQALVTLPWYDLAKQSWQLRDRFTEQLYQWDGHQLQENGLFIDLEPWRFHFFQFI